MDAPRAIVEIDGVDVRWDDLIDLKLENTLYFAADSFEIILNNEDMLSDWLRKEQEVKIYIGNVKNPQSWSKNELTHVFTGKIDGVKPSFSSGDTVQLIGRDYSARMIDTESSISFSNQKSHEIAILLARKYGLTPVVTPGDALLNKELFNDKKEWDILQALADLEGFVCYVDKSKRLYFGPRNSSDEQSIYTFTRVKGKANCTIEFDDSSVGVINKVTVRHWHKKRLIEASAQNDRLIKQMGQVKERIVYESKATSPSLAQSIANKRLAEWSRQVITARVWTPFITTNLAAEKTVTIEGCGRFDGRYYIDRISYSLSKSGASCDVDVTNIRPDTAQQYRQDLYENKGAKL